MKILVKINGVRKPLDWVVTRAEYNDLVRTGKRNGIKILRVLRW